MLLVKSTTTPKLLAIKWLTSISRSRQVMTQTSLHIRITCLICKWAGFLKTFNSIIPMWSIYGAGSRRLPTSNSRSGCQIKHWEELRSRRTVLTHSFYLQIISQHLRVRYGNTLSCWWYKMSHIYVQLSCGRQWFAASTYVAGCILGYLCYVSNHVV